MTARLIVRRVRRRAPPTQGELLPAWRHHAIFTDSPLLMLAAETDHRDHAIIERWLRLPPAARDGRVAVLPTVEHHCSAASVNRKLAALALFCEFHARHGVPLAGVLTAMALAGRRGGSRSSFKPFLHHVTKNNPQRRRRPTGRAWRC